MIIRLIIQRSDLVSGIRCFTRRWEDSEQGDPSDRAITQ